MSFDPVLQFVTVADDPFPVAAIQPGAAPTHDILLAWQQWLDLRALWPEALRASVALPNDLDIRQVLADLPRLGRVALQFPKWTDGRAYSQARLLRTRHRFAGELRAIGEVIPDMAAQLYRTGFDVAVLRDGESIEVAARMLRLIPAFYQADAHQRRPHFAREAAGSTTQGAADVATAAGAAA